MLGPFSAAPSGPLACLPLWRDPILLPGPEEGLDTVPIPTTPNKLANVFRTIKKKNRKKNKHARHSRRTNRK